MITRDRLSALMFLALSIAFFVMAHDIELYPGSEEEAINAQTFPKFVGAAGAVIALLMIVLPAGAEEKVDWAAFDWRRPLLLCVLMVGYGLTIKAWGFFAATTLFLVGGFVVLGERRWWAIFAASAPIAAGFEWVLHGLLDVFIDDPLLRWLGVM